MEAGEHTMDRYHDPDWRRGVSNRGGARVIVVSLHDVDAPQREYKETRISVVKLELLLLAITFCSPSKQINYGLLVRETAFMTELRSRERLRK